MFRCLLAVGGFVCMHVDSIAHNDSRDDPAPLCKADVDWTPCSHVQLSSDGSAIELYSRKLPETNTFSWTGKRQNTKGVTLPVKKLFANLQSLPQKPCANVAEEHHAVLVLLPFRFQASRLFSFSETRVMTILNGCCRTWFRLLCLPTALHCSASTQAAIAR